MPQNVAVKNEETLSTHIKAVLAGDRRFETAAQSVYRMIQEKGVRQITRGGKTVLDFLFFREGRKHIVGWYDEINDFVNFVKDAAEGGSAAEMAFVLVGEPGNGKTFFVDYVCVRYRRFLARPENRRYTFKFAGLDSVLGYGPKVAGMISATLEDPMILAMNLFDNSSQSREFLANTGFDEQSIDTFYRHRRPLGPSTDYLWRALVSHYEGDIEKALEHVCVIPVPMSESLGTVTGKYSAKDKITSSSVDLVGEEDLQRMMLLPIDDPNKFNLQRGALARVACGGIHFADEIFKLKQDLAQIYLQVIQNRNIEIDAYQWPMDVLIIATSNTAEYQRVVSEKEQAPLKDRCRICYVSHSTDYKLQFELTKYLLGNEVRTTVTGEPMHQDPNLIYLLSVAVVLTRLIRSAKLNPVDTMKLEAGEIAGDKSVEMLVEVKEAANASPDVTKRWGQKGLGHRDLGRVLQILSATTKSNENKCMFALDALDAFHRVILDYVSEATDREKYIKDIDEFARRLYRAQVTASLFNAYRDDPDAIHKDVMMYINMVVGMGSDKLGPDKLWRFRDPATGKYESIKIDETFINAVETRLGLSTQERKESHRATFRQIHGQRAVTEPNYDFMDNESLVNAVLEVKLESDVAGASSLIGALSNRTNEENARLYSRVHQTLVDKLGYCSYCADETIAYYCTPKDKS